MLIFHIFCRSYCENRRRILFWRYFSVSWASNKIKRGATLTPPTDKKQVGNTASQRNSRRCCNYFQGWTENWIFVGQFRIFVIFVLSAP